MAEHCKERPYLVGAALDAENIEAGEFSSWWWLRALIQTDFAMERRGLSLPNVPNVPAAIRLHPKFRLSAPLRRVFGRA